MKNKQVCEDFAQGNADSKTKHLFIEGNILYSYGYHYPLCVRLADGYIINSSGYSNTTARHTGEIVRATTNTANLKELQKAKKQDDYKHIIFMETQQIGQLLQDLAHQNQEIKATTYEEILNHKILKAL